MATDIDAGSSEQALRTAHDEAEASKAQLRVESAQLERSEAARRDLLRELAAAREEERRSVARDLHDSVGQLVTGLSLAFKALATSNEMTATMAVRLAEAQRVVDALGREVHHLAV